MVKYNKSFKDNWKNLNEFEEEGLRILNRGIQIIFENIKNENIISIYLKGSFLRREMNSKSDVDTVVICKTKEDLNILKNLQKKLGNSKELNFGFSGYTMKELKTGKLIKNLNGMRSGTSRFTRMLSTYFLLYGKKLNKDNLFKKTDLELFKSMIRAFENIFLPNYNKGNINFNMILKQSLWLLELEISVKNKTFKFKSWNNLVKYFDKNHFINNILKFRELEKISKDEKEIYIKNLIEYLDKLKKEFF